MEGLFRICVSCLMAFAAYLNAVVTFSSYIFNRNTNDIAIRLLTIFPHVSSSINRYRSKLHQWHVSVLQRHFEWVGYVQKSITFDWEVVPTYTQIYAFFSCLKYRGSSKGVLTHWGRDEMNAITQITFSSAFSWEKMFNFRLIFHWSLFLRVQLTIFQHWFR